MLTHECNQRLRVIRGGGVTGLVDLAGERVWIILEFEGGSIAPVPEKKPGMLSNALLETVVLSEVGVDGYPFAVDVFPRRRAHGARRPATLDAEQVLGCAYSVFSPTGLNNSLSHRHRRGYPGRRLCPPSIFADELDESLLGHSRDIGRRGRGRTRLGLDRAARSRGKERRSLYALFPMHDRHVVVPSVTGRLNDRVWNAFVAEGFGEARGRRSCNIVYVNFGVRMCPRPSGPEGVVPLVVSAIVSPALTQTRERSIASSGNVAHRPAAAAMAGENEIA